MYIYIYIYNDTLNQTKRGRYADAYYKGHHEIGTVYRRNERLSN